MTEPVAGPARGGSSPVDAAARGGAFAALQAVPLYEQVKRHVSESILIGDWPPGTVLPSETELARQFGVAVGTVRRALADLTGEGLLTRRRKTGTVVTGRTPHHSLRQFYQYFRLHGLDGALLRSRVEMLAAARAPATAEEAERLHRPEQGEVVRIERRRIVHGRPVMWDRMVMPAATFPDFPVADVPERIYPFVLARYGVRISAVRENVSAALADADDCRRLALDPPAALLVIDEVAYDPAGTPLIWAVHRALTDRFRYVNEVR